MITIHKYPIQVKSEDQTLHIPGGGKFLSVKVQNGVICLWFAVDTDGELAERKFRVYGTGHEIPVATENLQYIDTVLMDPYVWHVFELMPPQLSLREMMKEVLSSLPNPPIVSTTDQNPRNN